MNNAYRVYGVNSLGQFRVIGDYATLNEAEQVQNHMERNGWKDTEIEFDPAREPANRNR